MDVQRTSRFLSLVLRHKPEKAGLTLDAAGWARVGEVLKGCKISLSDLTKVVEDNNKQRFEFSPDGKLIRAVQGHSVAVDLGHKAQTPPEVLYHGTAVRFLDSIKDKGLVKGERHHVHLSAEIETARQVGTRHGTPVIMPVKAGVMHGAGILFYLTPNGVWLVDKVQPEYLDLAGLVY